MGGGIWPDLGHLISSGQRGQKLPIAEDWMLQSSFVKRHGSDESKNLSGKDCCWGITLELGADNRWRLFSVRNHHIHELPSAMKESIGGHAGAARLMDGQNREEGAGNATADGLPKLPKLPPRPRP